MEEEQTENSEASQQAPEDTSQPPVAPQTPVQSQGGVEEIPILPEKPVESEEVAQTTETGILEQSPADMQQAVAPQAEQTMAPAPQPGQPAEPSIPQSGQPAELQVPVPSQVPPAEEEVKKPIEEQSEQNPTEQN